jgi:hypothetical protein
MKPRATVAACAAFTAIFLTSRAEAGCVIAPDGKSIDVVTDNGTSDEKTCSVACQVDTKIGVVQVSCGGTTPPLAKAHSLCNFDKPEPWYKRVVSSADSCKGDTASAPPVPPPAARAAVKAGTAICRISPDGHSFDAVIANPYSSDATCQVDCKISTTVAGTTAQSSCTNNVGAGAGEAVLCTHTFNAGRLVKVIGDTGQCYDPTPKKPAAENDDDTPDPDKLMNVPMPKPSRAKKDDVDMQELANDPDKLREYMRKQLPPEAQGALDDMDKP